MQPACPPQQPAALLSIEAPRREPGGLRVARHPVHHANRFTAPRTPKTHRSENRLPGAGTGTHASAPLRLATRRAARHRSPRREPGGLRVTRHPVHHANRFRAPGTPKTHRSENRLPGLTHPPPRHGRSAGSWESSTASRRRSASSGGSFGCDRGLGGLVVDGWRLSAGGSAQRPAVPPARAGGLLLAARKSFGAPMSFWADSKSAPTQVGRSVTHAAPSPSDREPGPGPPLVEAGLQPAFARPPSRP